MSTIAVIGWKIGEVCNRPWGEDVAFKGVYSHFDGYPEGLGYDVYSKIMELWVHGKDLTSLLDAFVEVYIKGHREGWSVFSNEKCYCHDVSRKYVYNGEGDVQADFLNATNVNPLYIEYGYIIDAEEGTMIIIEGANVGKVEYFGTKEKENVYKHRILATVKFDKNKVLTKDDFEKLRQLSQG